MGRLRRTLAVYYKDEGREELLQIDIPNRKYIATFSKFQSASQAKSVGEPGAAFTGESTSEPKLLTAERLTKCAVRLYKQGQYSEHLQCQDKIQFSADQKASSALHDGVSFHNLSSSALWRRAENPQDSNSR